MGSEAINVMTAIRSFGLFISEQTWENRNMNILNFTNIKDPNHFGLIVLIPWKVKVQLKDNTNLEIWLHPVLPVMIDYNLIFDFFNLHSWHPKSYKVNIDFKSWNRMMLDQSWDS